MIFVDTSALLKRYAEEPGTQAVRDSMSSDPEWAASALALAEASVSLCHRGPEGRPSSRPQRQLEAEWARFHVVPVDAACLAAAIVIGCGHRVRTLDAIQLAAAARLPGAVRFITFDRRQADVAAALGMEVVPT